MISPDTPSPIPEQVDVLVIGGGINGISTFRELALQGVNVILLERDDFCAGASAALSRMVHGGLRYLENGELRLVRQSLQERDRLLRNAPHYVSPLPTVVPVSSWFRGTLPTIATFFGAKATAGNRPGIMIRSGLVLYDLLARNSRVMPRHRGLSRAALRKMVPGITEKAKGGVLYYDARVTHPERLGLEMVLDVEGTTNARAHSYTEITGASGTDLLWRDRLTGATGRIAPRIVINATGAWVDRVETALHPNSKLKRVQGTKGSHLMIRNPDLLAALGDRMVYYEHFDGRICIAFAHAGAAMVGSTDIRIDDPGAAVCLETEKAYMLKALAGVFPDLVIREDQIVHLFTGVRPLPVGEQGATGRISRDHAVVVEPVGAKPYAVLTLIGGKWTTFRVFGEEVADLALMQMNKVRSVHTHEARIGGGRDLPMLAQDRQIWVRASAAKFGLTEARFAILAARYGSRAHEVAAFMQLQSDAALINAPDYSRREMQFLIKHERVRDIGDLLLRRTTLGIEGRITPELLAETLGLVAQALAWSEAEETAANERFQKNFARQHKVQRAAP